jgi:hypothetical protein
MYGEGDSQRELKYEIRNRADSVVELTGCIVSGTEK